MTNGKLNLLLATVSTAAIIGGQAAITPATAQLSVVSMASVVSGQVTRGDNGSNLAGATVSIPALNLETTTGRDGRFRFPNVPAGEYNLNVNFLGAGDTARSIEVGDNDLNVDIVISTDNIIVTGRRGALASARAQERASDQIKSIISSDDIGNFADQNVAESLQRVPGVTINRSEGEGRQPAVRGLSGGFVTLTVDGAQLGSRASDRGLNENRSVDLDILSSDLLSGIEVVKTLTPDIDSDSIGGAINLRTQSALDVGKDTLRARAEIAYQEKADAVNEKFSGNFTKVFEDTGAGDFGIAGGFSYQNREGFVDDFRTDDGIRTTDLGTDNEPNDLIEEIDNPNIGDNLGEDDDDDNITPEAGIISVNRIDQRADPNRRKRLSGNLNMEWRPNQDTDLFLRGTYARFEDDDVRQRERIELNDGDDEEILLLGASSGSIADVDFSKRIRFTEQVDDVYSITGGGEFRRDAWTFNLQGDYSLNKSDAPSVEGRFRERDIIANYENLGIDGVDFNLAANPADNSDPFNPDNFDFRFMTAYDFISEDEILSIKGDIQRDFQFNGRPAFIKAGAKYKARERTIDINRFNVESPDDLTLSDFTLQENGPEQSDLNFFFTPELDELNPFLWDLRTAAETGAVPIQADEFNDFASIARDNTIEENVLAGYVMGDFQLTDNLKIITGVRIERTKYTGLGNFASLGEFNEDATDALIDGLQAALDNSTATFTEEEAIAFLGPRVDQTATSLAGIEVFEDVVFDSGPRAGSNEYTDFFPNFNLRWEPNDDIVVRFAYTEALQRPEFGQISPNVLFTFSEDVDEDDVDDFITGTLGNEITSLADAAAAQAAGGLEFENEAGNSTEPLRNPNLNPMRARQLDASIGWYPNDDTAIIVGAFYKNIKDFILRATFSNDELTQIGLTPNTSGTIDGGFNTSETFLNGDKAQVYGIEIAYEQAYTFLPQPFDGLFFAGNATIAQSEATDADIGRDITLPEQADFTGNMSLGYENELFSIRWSGNYVGRRLRSINAGELGLSFSESDELERARFSMDINARVNVADGIQLYFDANNINDAEDRRYFRGGGITGPVYSRIENYGATYQGGVRVRF